MCDRKVSDLSVNEYEVIQAKMCDIKFSSSPFLAQDESLMSRIANDLAAISIAEITIQQIYDCLKSIMDKARRKASTTISKEVADINEIIRFDTRGWCLQNISDSEIIDHDVNFRVTRLSWEESQECPFLNDKKYHGYEYGADDYRIINMATGEKIIFGSLLPHMILHHNFFEGVAANYRLNPEDIIRVLKLEPNISYAPTYTIYNAWKFMSGQSDIDKDISDLFNHDDKQYYFTKKGSRIQYFIDAEDKLCVKYDQAQQINSGQAQQDDESIEFEVDGYNLRIPFLMEFTKFSRTQVKVIDM